MGLCRIASLRGEGRDVGSSLQILSSGLRRKQCHVKGANRLKSCEYWLPPVSFDPCAISRLWYRLASLERFVEIEGPWRSWQVLLML